MVFRDITYITKKNTFIMEYNEALKIAEKTMATLAPHCEKISIAGSIRRKKSEVKDIEILAIPKPYTPGGIFEDGIATVINRWKKVKGTLPCKYTQRVLPEGIKLDLFFTTPENWGYRLATRTGPALYSQKVLSIGYLQSGYKSVKGDLIDKEGRKVATYEEEDFYNLIGLEYVEPEFRKYP